MLNVDTLKAAGLNFWDAAREFGSWAKRQSVEIPIHLFSDHTIHTSDGADSALIDFSKKGRNFLLSRLLTLPFDSKILTAAAMQAKHSVQPETVWILLKAGAEVEFFFNDAMSKFKYSDASYFLKIAKLSDAQLTNIEAALVRKSTAHKEYDPLSFQEMYYTIKKKRELNQGKNLG